MSTNGRTQIVILGGGFGGVYTAMHLRVTGVTEHEVTLSDGSTIPSSKVLARNITATLRAPTVSHVEHGEHPSPM